MLTVFVNRLLSSKGFLPLGRLTFCVYLIHLPKFTIFWFPTLAHSLNDHPKRSAWPWMFTNRSWIGWCSHQLLLRHRTPMWQQMCDWSQVNVTMWPSSSIINYTMFWTVYDLFRTGICGGGKRWCFFLNLEKLIFAFKLKGEWLKRGLISVVKNNLSILDCR